MNFKYSVQMAYPTSHESEWVGDPYEYHSVAIIAPSAQLALDIATIRGCDEAHDNCEILPDPELICIKCEIYEDEDNPFAEGNMCGDCASTPFEKSRREFNEYFRVSR